LPPEMDFDVSSDAHFHSWDNSSLFDEVIRAQGQAPLNNDRVRASTREFFRALFRGSRSKWHWVRFSGRFMGLSEQLSAEVAEWSSSKLAPKSLRETPIPPSLSFSSVGSSSVGRYDHFHTTRVLLSGQEHISLSPPSDALFLRPYPKVHPMAGQVRTYLGPNTNTTTGARVLSTVIAAGEAVFIPAGWVHQTTTVEVSAAISFSAFPDWHRFMFEFLGASDLTLLPFLKDADKWSDSKIQEVFSVYLPELFRNVFPEPMRPPEEWFRFLSTHYYGEETLRELGSAPEPPWERQFCPKLAEDDILWNIGHVAAVEIAREFLKVDADQRSLYFLWYLERILPTTVGTVGDQSSTNTTESMVAVSRYLRACFVGEVQHPQHLSDALAEHRRAMLAKLSREAVM